MFDSRLDLQQEAWLRRLPILATKYIVSVPCAQTLALHNAPRCPLLESHNKLFWARRFL
jgi:hypothetical protein